MEKESKYYIDNNFSDVFLIGKNDIIFNSLKNLTNFSRNLIIKKINFSKDLIKKKELIIVDDSINNLHEKINFFEKNKFTNFFLLINNKNIKIIETKKYKVFFKPLKIFELHNEICKRVSKNTLSNNYWKLDRSKLRFYKNSKIFITLTEKEFYFIFFILQNKGHAVDKKEILKKVWKINNTNIDSMLETRVVETIVSSIRKKLDSIKNPPKIIKEEFGYKMLV